MKNKYKFELLEFRLLGHIAEDEFFGVASELFDVVNNDAYSQMELYKGQDGLWVTFTRFSDEKKATEYFNILQNKDEFQRYLGMIDDQSIKEVSLERII